MCIWGCVSTAFYLKPVVSGLLVMTSIGGTINVVAHMNHESGDSEVATNAAFTILLGPANLIIFTFFTLTSGMLVLVLVGVLVALAIALWFHGWPVHSVRVHHVAQYTDGKHRFVAEL